jgi:lysophospholipase L1-like esterase
MSKIAIGLFLLLALTWDTPRAQLRRQPAVPWTYTALGDSLAVGVGGANSNGYVSLYAANCQTDTGNTITLNNLGMGGWTSSQLLAAVRADQSFRNSIANSQVVTVNIGSNDLIAAMQQFVFATCGGPDNQDCLRAAITLFKNNWDAIIAEILSLRNTNNTLIRTMNIYNPVVNLLRQQGALEVANFYIGQANDHIERTSEQNHIILANVFFAFNGANGETDPGSNGLLAGDNFHPNDNGYALIAALFRAARYAPLHGSQNSIDDARFFVGQQYRDFLVRQPDTNGGNFWTEQITGNAGNTPPPCPMNDALCLTQRRVSVSAAFFVENEFQDSGSFVYRFYKASLGRNPTYLEFTPDRKLIIGSANFEQLRQNFATAWVQREAFVTRYPLAQNAGQFVDALLATVQQASGINLTAQRATLISKYNAQATQTASRARVVRLVADDAAFRQAEYNKAFVLMQYFGYLKREIDQAGYDFWLNQVSNNQPGNYRGMVCAFITSLEYQLRFGSLTTRTNQDCTGIQ